MRWIVERRGGGRDEKLRYFLLVQIRANRAVRPTAPGAEDQQDLIFFDQLAGQFSSAKGTGAAVDAYEVDPATVNPTLIVNHLEVCGLGAPG